MYNLVLAKWKKTLKSRSGLKQVRFKKKTTHPCIPVSLTILGLFNTLKDAVVGLIRAAQSAKDEQTIMLTTLSDY